MHTSTFVSTFFPFGLFFFYSRLFLRQKTHARVIVSFLIKLMDGHFVGFFCITERVISVIVKMIISFVISVDSSWGGGGSGEVD